MYLALYNVFPVSSYVNPKEDGREIWDGTEYERVTCTGGPLIIFNASSGTASPYHDAIKKMLTPCHKTVFLENMPMPMHAYMYMCLYQ